MVEVYRDKERGHMGVYSVRLGNRVEPREMTNRTKRWEITMEVPASLLIDDFHILRQITTRKVRSGPPYSRTDDTQFH